MKKIKTLLVVLLAVLRTFADIPVDKNGHNIESYTTTNLLPWVLLILLAVGLLLFLKTLKNEKNAHY